MGKVKLNFNGFRQLRQDPAIMHELTEQARKACDRANALKHDGKAEYDYAVARTTDRGSIALVSTGHGTSAHVKAMNDNARHNTLQKAVFG